MPAREKAKTDSDPVTREIGFMDVPFTNIQTSGQGLDV